MAVLYIVALAWIYVVGLMAIAEATAPQGSVLGAIVTLVLYGLLPLGVSGYLLATPMRRRARQRRDEAAAASAGPYPHGGGHATADPVAPVGEEARGVGDDVVVARRDPPDAGRP